MCGVFGKCGLRPFGRISALAVCISIAIQLAAPPPASALDPKKNIDQYGHNVWVRQNGLPANLVTSAVQGAKGYIWLGTSAGLFRFDGVNFDNIPTDPGNGKDRQTVTSLCEGRDGSLWIGTIFSGLRRLKNDSLSVFGLKQGFYDTQVWSLVEDRSGHLLIGTSIGLYMYADGKFRTVLSSPNYVAGVCEDSLGRIWVATHNGLRVFTEKSVESEVHPSPIMSVTLKDGLNNEVTTCVMADRKGGVWIGTFGGLAHWVNGKITNYGTAQGLPDYQIDAIYEDHNGNVWVGTRKGLSRLDAGKWSVYSQADGLSDDYVTGFAEDDEGSLWVCTANGLNQFENVDITTYTTKEGLASDYVSSVIGTPDGSLYFLSDQGSCVTRFKDGKRTVYNIPVGPAFVSRDGSLWIGQTGALYRIRNGNLTKYGRDAGLPEKWISAITEDNRSLILYVDHTGLFRFAHGRLTPYRTSRGETYPAEEAATCFCRQSDGVLWIGSADSLMEIENGKITGYTTADGLAGNWTSSIYDDHRGDLWISSPQGGLTRYRNGKFTPFNSHEGLFTDAIFCVVGDTLGNLWLSSPRGIGRVSIRELNAYADGLIQSISMRVFGTADGMKREECFGYWQPAGWRAPDGKIWFATRKGAVSIDPGSFRENEIPPPVTIESVYSDKKEVPHNKPAVFAPGTKDIEFHYAALSFLVPQRVLFKYELVGYDKGWIEAGTRHAAYYTNLPPGDYRFRVIACNNDGVWNTTGASFPFVLKPHFYQTTWFLVLMIIGAIGIAFGIYRLRVWQLLAREKELNDRIQEAVASIKVLGGLIPICSNCKKIRDDKGYWEHLEKYIQTHSEAQFSHGICPDCAAKLYPDYNLGGGKDRTSG